MSRKKKNKKLPTRKPKEEGAINYNEPNLKEFLEMSKKFKTSVEITR